jgi:hypothetical protein
MAHHISIYFLDVGLGPLDVIVPLCLLYIWRRDFHLNHLVLWIDVMYKEGSPLNWLIIWLFLILKVWNTYYYVFMISLYLVLRIWYKRKMILRFGFSKLDILSFSLPIFCKVSRSKTWSNQKRWTKNFFIQVSSYICWKLGLLTSLKSLSQTYVKGKVSIYKTREIQIECHLFNWIEYEPKFIWYHFKYLRRK